MTRALINFSGVPHGQMLGKIIRFPLRLIPSQMVVPVMQGRLRGHRWIAGSSTHGCWLGSYEYDKQLLFEKVIKRGSVVYDVGANVGFYSLLASTLVGPEGKVLAFEPVPRNLHYLREHIRLNRTDNVSVIEAAVSNKNGTAFFDEGPSNSMGHIAAQGRLEVKTLALDTLIASGQAAAPDYMKIDVEGAELQVLQGARALLAQARPIVFLATHGRHIHEQCCDYLRSMDYQLEAIQEGSVDETDEILARPRS